jgi:phage-related tail fiber protein
MPETIQVGGTPWTGAAIHTIDTMRYKMASKYFALLTERGAVKIAQATALGTQVKITQMAIGDGGGFLPVPSSSQTKLVNERRRAVVNSLISTH